jgi:hypothetical protein
MIESLIGFSSSCCPIWRCISGEGDTLAWTNPAQSTNPTATADMTVRKNIVVSLHWCVTKSVTDATRIGGKSRDFE